MSSNSTRACVRCGSTDRNASGKCRPCKKANALAHTAELLSTPCGICGTTNRFPSGGCKTCAEARPKPPVSEKLLTKPCRKCGATDRLPSGNCRPCKQAGRKPTVRAPPTEALLKKPCPKCGVVDRNKNRGQCNQCVRNRSATWLANNPEKLQARRALLAEHPEIRQAYDLKRFELTVVQYTALLAIQDGLCAICRKPEASIDKKTGKLRRLAVDHDRKCCPGRNSCGKCIRGLLCACCNPGVGQFKDDPLLLARAIIYLKPDWAMFKAVLTLIIDLFTASFRRKAG